MTDGWTYTKYFTVAIFYFIKGKTGNTDLLLGLWIGKTVTLDPDTSIEVPEDRYGLYAIDSLDPDMVSYISYQTVVFCSL